ncbi:hypothetical protein [Streptomyces sp. SP18BB07]|uniref:hypothetical protein n=1 Tax=Streptomyces sp. SP18BB07 TaxID=3002522 RepID=UPI002E7A13B2|nr:hypothetical protein [Streptomyces sp. SP18BB07]MEE1764452.1 hypothetical protein [Streptomyces sp. SP18BB07]
MKIQVQYYDSVDGMNFVWKNADFIEPVKALVRSESELAIVIATYAPKVAVRMESRSYPCFRIVVHCLTTGYAVGQWMWERQQVAEVLRFLPAEDPWFTWDDRLRLEKLTERMRAGLAEEGAGTQAV